MFKKDGKLFGKISVIDLVAVLAVIVIACGAAVRFSGSGSRVPAASGEPMECVTEVKNIRRYNVDALKKGGSVFDRTTKEYIGEIVDVTEKPGTTMLLLADGTYKEVPVEGRYTAYVTISFHGKEGDGGYYTDTNRQMCVGSTLNMNAKFSQCESTIVEVGHAAK